VVGSCEATVALSCASKDVWQAGQYCTSNTDLCVEGYPSSANTFAYNLFKVLRPRITYAHHTHTIANLRRAEQHDVPALVLFRDPEDAVPSFASRFRLNTVEAGLRYIDYYSYVLKNLNRVLLVSFEEMTQDTTTAVDRFTAWSGCDFGSFEPDKMEEDVFERIEEWTRKHGRNARKHGRSAKVSFPREEREARKEELRSELEKTSVFQGCRSVYESLLCRYKGSSAQDGSV
jgi:hypothetical protein